MTPHKQVTDALLITATHEAGHVVAIRHSEYFTFHDRAIQTAATGDINALAGMRRIKVPVSPEECASSVRDFVRISISGRAAELLLAKRTTSQGRPVIAGTDGSLFDLRRAKATLESQQMQHEYDDLQAEALQLLERQWQEVEAVVALFLSCHPDEISKAQVEALFQ